MINYIEAWQELIVEPYPWVLFANGTCVILAKPNDNLEEQATALLRSLFSRDGEAFGDFGVHPLDAQRGWIVTSPHPDIVTLVTFDEVPEEYREDTLSIASHARAKRKVDADSCRVIHVYHQSVDV